MEAVLDTLMSNSLNVRLAERQMEAKVLDNKSIKSWADPEVEFNYLFGDEESGNRRDLVVQQAIKSQNLSGINSKIANANNQIAEYEKEQAVRNLRLEARNTLIDLTIANTLLRKFGERTHLAQKLVNAEKKRLELGEASVMEYHKAEMYLATVSAQKLRAETEIATLSQDILRMNGGVGVPVAVYNLEVEDFETTEVGEDFEEFFVKYQQKTPNTGAEAAREAAALELRSQRMDWLPELRLGYMQEVTDVEKFRGIATGISIPLWRNGRETKMRQIAVDMAETSRQISENERYSAKRRLYERVMSLRNLCSYYHKSLDKFGDVQTIYKAFQEGEIPLAEFISENDMYYEFFEQHLESERERLKAEAELLR